MIWETVIGLEVHAQLQTKSKIFSGSSTTYGAEPNTQASNIDIALPGVLPTMNKTALHMAVKFGLAIDSKINQTSVFARKNYFYPDLPKGYQISQFELPIVEGGYIDIQLDDNETKRIGVTRAHLEEDAGKSLHEDFQGMTGIDLNRAGTPLLEIVSEPDIRSASQAVSYLKKLHSLVRYLGICDGNMQEGSFRCDANVSVRPKGQAEFGTRAEIKNINSFKFVEKAINHEVQRQIELIEDGGEVVQETRLYDADLDETRSMRSKEEAHDYRYFPDPDLPPMYVDNETIESIRRELPELPEQKANRFVEQYGLSKQDADVLISDIATADFFEETTKLADNDAKSSANWINGELAAALNKNELSINDSPISCQQLALLIKRINDKTISNKIAKQLLQAIWDKEGNDIDELIEAKGLKQISDSSVLDPIIDELIKNNPNQVKQFKDGNEKIIGFFVGQIMKATQGKANPQQVNEVLKDKLNNS